MVDNYMKRSITYNDVVVFFDDDYVPYRYHRSLATWADLLQHPFKLDDEPISEKNSFDFVLYDRGFLDAIASGSYLARSSP